MSAISTRSSFYYGHTITRTNNWIDFDEGGGELSIELDVGDYTLTEFVDELETKLNAAGALTYTVTVNRTNRKITIAASGTFSLLVATGSHLGTSVYPLVGFTGADRTSAATYTGNLASGSEYLPQSLLSDYVKAEDYQVKEDAVVNRSASGNVQTIQFGDTKRIEMVIQCATDKDMSASCTTDVEDNATGVADLRAFMEYAITKAKIEFMPDRSTPATFYKVLLEKTPESRQGTEFQIYDMKGAMDFYTTKDIQWRVVT